MDYQLQKKIISTFFFRRNQLKLFPLTEVVITANEADNFITHYIKKMSSHFCWNTCPSSKYFLHFGDRHCEIKRCITYCATHKDTTGSI